MSQQAVRIAWQIETLLSLWVDAALATSMEHGCSKPVVVVLMNRTAK